MYDDMDGELDMMKLAAGIFVVGLVIGGILL